MSPLAYVLFQILGGSIGLGIGFLIAWRVRK